MGENLTLGEVKKHRAWTENGWLMTAVAPNISGKALVDSTGIPTEALAMQALLAIFHQHMQERQIGKPDGSHLRAYPF